MAKPLGTLRMGMRLGHKMLGIRRFSSSVGKVGLSFLMAACLLAAPSIVVAQDAETQPPTESNAAPTSEEIDQLIQQLDAKRFADRSEASRRLATLGEQAIESLQKAAGSESRETSVRSIEILKEHLESEDETLKTAARQALETLAQGEGAGAQRAADALKPKAETPNRPQAMPGNIQIGGGNIQIQVQAIAGNQKSVRVKNVNGVKEIEVDENGEKTKIIEDPANGIKVEVTRKTKEGQEETKKYEAKDAEELKQKHPEAHKLFDKYSKENGIGIQVQGIQLGGQVPIQPRLMLPQPFPQTKPIYNPQQAARDIRKARDEIEQLIEEAKLIDKDLQGDRLKGIVERLEETQQKLDEAIENMGPFAR
jgi:hypothetical protein